MQLSSALFDPSSKNEKNPPRKNSLYFRKWSFLAVILKHFLYFLIFLEMEPFSSSLKNKNKFTPKKFLIFWEMELPNSNIVGSRNFKKLLIFPEVTFWDQKMKKLLIFQEVTCKCWKYFFFLNFSYKEAQFSKLKYFFIIIMRHFFSFYRIFFFYTQQAFVFHLVVDFYMVHSYVVTFFLFLKNFGIFHKLFFYSLYFLDTI